MPEDGPTPAASQGMVFRDRQDAGVRLGRALLKAELHDPLVLGLPRGGIPVAYEAAIQLHAPLDVLVVRKLGAPGNPELGMGAIAEGNQVWLNEEIVGELGVTRAEIDEAIARESREVARRVERYRGGRALPDLKNRNVVLIDDGLATGATAMAGALALKAQGAMPVVLAVPVAARESIELLSTAADRVICLEVPPQFYAVGSWYDDFSQLSDEEVISILDLARRSRAA